MTALAKLFSDQVAIAIADESAWHGVLYPEESYYLANMHPQRRREFTAGRVCARRVLQTLGIECFPLRVGEGRAPLWPPTVIGSISHCDGFCAAVAMRPVDGVLGIGLDVEPSGPLDEEVVALVCTEVERVWCRSAPFLTEGAWGKIIFSAKESVYKALFPVSGLFLEFQDVELEIDPAVMRFRARLTPSAPCSLPEAICGRIEIDEKYVYTGATLRRN